MMVVESLSSMSSIKLADPLLFFFSSSLIVFGEVGEESEKPIWISLVAAAEIQKRERGEGRGDLLGGRNESFNWT